MTCQKCSGFLRLDVDDQVKAVVCLNCGARSYPPFQPHVLSVERLAQAQWCQNCGMEKAMRNKTLGPRCMGARILQGKATAGKKRERGSATASSSPSPTSE